MSKAKEILKMTKMFEADDLTAGDNVKFKDGGDAAKLHGVDSIGKVGQVNKDGTLMVFVGKSLMGPFAATDLEKIPASTQENPRKADAGSQDANAVANANKGAVDSTKSDAAAVAALNK